MWLYVALNVEYLWHFSDSLADFIYCHRSPWPYPKMMANCKLLYYIPLRKFIQILSCSFHSPIKQVYIKLSIRSITLMPSFQVLSFPPPIIGILKSRGFYPLHFRLYHRFPSAVIGQALVKEKTKVWKVGVIRIIRHRSHKPLPFSYHCLQREW